MKKLFVAILALGALASCQNEVTPSVDLSNKKSVSITISNGVSDTRALVGESTPTADGGVAEIQAQAKAEACATTDELVILFANGAGNVVEARTFDQADMTSNTEVTNPNGDNYTYTFHQIHESVQQVAVVRSNNLGTTIASYAGTNLEVYADAAAEERDVVAVSQLDLYASSELLRDENNATCTTNEGTFPLFHAELTVQPALARVEITGLSCSDLGETTFKSVGDATITGGYDELALKSVTFGVTQQYSYAFGENDVLKGVYAGNGNTEKRALVSYSAGEGQAIAWNIAPSVPFFSEGYPMTFTVMMQKVALTGANIGREVYSSRSLFLATFP